MAKRLSFLLAILVLLALLWPIRNKFAHPENSANLQVQSLSTSSALEAPTEIGAEELAQAHIRLLFVGNSHTHFQNLPDRVVKLLQHIDPDAKIAGKTVPVGFLDDAAKDPNMEKLLKEHAWTGVILQAQKISSSGRTNYSTAEGIDLAKRAKELGIPVFFFAEWGLKGSANSTERTNKIYAEMAEASGATLIPVGLAWEKVLQQSPDLALHDFDGNHQSSLGADLTALVLAASIAKQPLQKWDQYVPTTATSEQWQLFLKASP